MQMSKQVRFALDRSIENTGYVMISLFMGQFDYLSPCSKDNTLPMQRVRQGRIGTANTAPFVVAPFTTLAALSCLCWPASVRASFSLPPLPRCNSVGGGSRKSGTAVSPISEPSAG